MRNPGTLTPGYSYLDQLLASAAVGFLAVIGLFLGT